MYTSPVSRDQSKARLYLRARCSSATAPAPSCCLHTLTRFPGDPSPDEPHTLESLPRALPLGNLPQDTKLEATLSSRVKPCKEAPQDNEILYAMQLVMGSAFVKQKGKVLIRGVRDGRNTDGKVRLDQEKVGNCVSANDTGRAEES